jgi:hypothetical protein
MKRPVGVTIVSVLAIIGGGIQLLASLGYLGFTALRTSLILGTVSGITPTMILGTGVLSVLIGVLAIAFGIGALSLKTWSWLTGLIVWGTSLLISVVQLAVTGVAFVPVVSGIIAVAILVYLSSAPVRTALGVETGDHYTTHTPSAV